VWGLTRFLGYAKVRNYSSFKRKIRVAADRRDKISLVEQLVLELKSFREKQKSLKGGF